MESHDEEHAAKLLRAQTHIWNHIFSFINSMSLKCVVDLGIPDIIHNYGQPMPLSNLIASLPIHPSKTCFVHCLMRIMIHSGFFSQQNHDLENELEAKYVLTDASVLLLKNHPLSVTPFLHAMLDPVLTNPWNQFSTWFKNGDPTPFETAHGKMFWDYAGADPKLNHLFNDAMASDARFVTSLVIEKCKGVFMGLESLVDVGGGSENLKYVAGDMFEAIPPADAILLKITPVLGLRSLIKIYP
uniref:O-methyltransferase domain-containing protein n=1 Tax=Glycine max TaxID=3847 RepID=K7M863_SOYBN